LCFGGLGGPFLKIENGRCNWRYARPASQAGRELLPGCVRRRRFVADPGPGRLAKLAERGMIRPSFIPGRPQRQIRDLTRYRRTLTHERTREMQRAEKLLEDA
jgi:hypothetical protein